MKTLRFALIILLAAAVAAGAADGVSGPKSLALTV